MNQLAIMTTTSPPIKTISCGIPRARNIITAQAAISSAKTIAKEFTTSPPAASLYEFIKPEPHQQMQTSLH